MEYLNKTNIYQFHVDKMIQQMVSPDEKEDEVQINGSVFNLITDQEEKKSP